MHVGDHEVWQPDLVLYNSATGSAIDHFGNTHCIIYNTGKVLWVPPAQFQSFCELDMRHWPFDIQICTLLIGSWTYNGNQIDLILNNDETDISNDLNVVNTQWDITNITSRRYSKVYSCCEEPYISVQYNLTLTRRSPMFKAVVIAPATIIIWMTLINFWLPAQAGEKIFINGLNAIIIVAFLIFFAYKLPALAMNTPLVGK